MGTSAVLPKTGILQTRPRPLSSHAHTMEGNALLFQNDMTYKTTIDGTINGESFQVIGEGTSKAPHGDFNIHAVCTTGKLPFSWKVLSHTLQYGFPMFANYPNGLTHFTRECYHEGVTIDRTVRSKMTARCRLITLTSSTVHTLLHTSQ